MIPLWLTEFNFHQIEFFTVSSQASLKFIGSSSCQTELLDSCHYHVYLVICNSCYWCASYFNIDGLESLSVFSSHVLDCHISNFLNIELISSVRMNVRLMGVKGALKKLFALSQLV